MVGGGRGVLGFALFCGGWVGFVDYLLVMVWGLIGWVVLESVFWFILAVCFFLWLFGFVFFFTFVLFFKLAS